MSENYFIPIYYQTFWRDISIKAQMKYLETYKTNVTHALLFPKLPGKNNWFNLKVVYKLKNHSMKGSKYTKYY